jgi:hypothetical protein
MSADEYLEKIFADAYKREGDQEENVARTLPFFATALTLLATTLGLVRQAIPEFSFSTFAVVSYVALLGITATVGAVLWFLLLAVHRREFEYVASEAGLKEYAAELHKFYEHTGATDDEITRAVVADLRQLMIEQYAKATGRNRAHNAARALARTRAITALISSLAFAFVLIGAILVHDIGSRGHAHGGAKGNRASTTLRDGPRREVREDVPQAEPTRGEARDKGKLGDKDSSDQRNATEGGEEMSAKESGRPSSAPSQTVTPSAPTTPPAPARPAPPPTQTFTKGADGGNKR